MATATLSDFQIYEAQFQDGLWEGVSQALEAFNGASAGAILLSSLSHIGNYKQEAFFPLPSDLITRRDNTSVSAATAIKPTQEEFVSVKLERKIGPMTYTEDSIRKLGKTLQEASFIFGKQIGEEKMRDMLNDALTSVNAALEGQSSILFDATALSVKTLTTGHLNSAMAKLGDQSSRIVAWAMRSKPFHDLIGEQITSNVTNVADRVIYGGGPGSLGKPIIVTDAPALLNDVASTDTYNVLGLVAGAVGVEESEQGEMLFERVGGLESIVQRIQGEYSKTIGVKGFQWDISNGGANPNEAAIATTTNWDKIATSIKDCAGVRLLCQ